MKRHSPYYSANRPLVDGSKAEAMERFGGKAEEVDLAGKTLLPGFIAMQFWGQSPF